MTRVGVIGMGIRGCLYTRILRTMHDVEVAAACDPYKWETVARELDVRAYADVDRFFAEERLDAVIVATPDHLHVDPLTRAIRYGAPILVEKPLAMSVEDGRRLVDAVSGRGITAMMAFENRWNAPFVEARRSIAAGEVGRLAALNVRLNDTIMVPTRMLAWAALSSPAWFLLSHVADLAFWMGAGRPVTVYAVGRKEKLMSLGVNTWDGIQATVKFDSGCTAQFETLWILPECMPSVVDFQFEIVGETGAVFVNLHDQMVHKAAARYEHPSTTMVEFPGRFAGTVASMLESFIRVVRGAKEDVPTLEDGLRSVELVAAVHRSLETGNAVRV